MAVSDDTEQFDIIFHIQKQKAALEKGGHSARKGVDREGPREGP